MSAEHYFANYIFSMQIMFLQVLWLKWFVWHNILYHEHESWSEMSDLLQLTDGCIPVQLGWELYVMMLLWQRSSGVTTHTFTVPLVPLGGMWNLNVSLERSHCLIYHLSHCLTCMCGRGPGVHSQHWEEEDQWHPDEIHWTHLHKHTHEDDKLCVIISALWYFSRCI